MAAIDPTFVLSNRIEAGLWLVIALAMAVAAWRRERAVERTRARRPDLIADDGSEDGAPD